MKDDNVEYRDYDQTYEGIIQSYCERWEPVFLMDVYEEWNKHE
jgi:hypothetical protein